MRMRHAFSAAVVAFSLMWGASNASAQIIYTGGGYAPYPGGYFPPPVYNLNSVIFPNQMAYSSYQTYSYRSSYYSPYSYGSYSYGPVVYPAPVYRSYYYPGGAYYNYGYPVRPHHRFR